MKITDSLLRSWGACSDGREYFKSIFPQGAEYATAQQQIATDHRYDWSHWLTNAAFSAAIKSPDNIATLVQDEIKSALDATKDSPQSAFGNYSKAASSGDRSTAASSGDGSTAASSGYVSTAASSGDRSTAASSGKYSKAASSGDGSTAASSGYGSKAASVGLQCFSKAGDNGCFVLFWNDGKRDRVTVAYVGENGIKADTLYGLNASGELVEAS